MTLRLRALGALSALATLLASNALLTPSAAADPVEDVPPAAPAAPAARAAAASGSTPTAPAWGACSSSSLDRRGAECAMLQVPLDYDRPGGTKIRIAISRIRHTTKAYQGVMLVNPGGPGTSGLDLATRGESIPRGAGDSYDWIGFDPRGVGQSEPAVSCDPSYGGYERPRYVPSRPTVMRSWFDRSNAYTTACERKNGAILDHLRTVDSANDLESIRKALGEEQINYYGFSYGTYLGQVYATLYPDRLRRAVFDGTVDPRGVWYKDNLAQNRGFEHNMNAWFAWIAKHDAVYDLGKTEEAVRSAFYRAQEELYASPAGGRGGRISGSEWNDTFLSAGFYVYGWADLAAAFSDYVHWGDIRGVEDNYSYDGNNPAADNGYAAYLGVQCTDTTTWPKAWSTWERDAERTYRTAPYGTWGNTWLNEPCRHWPGKARKAVTISGKKVKSLLMVNETRDAATPYSGALEVRQRFGKARLIEGVGGTTHAASLSGVACVEDRVADYLATGALPKRKSGRRSDVTCPPVPAPDPAAYGGAKTSGAAKDVGPKELAELRRPGLGR